MEVNQSRSHARLLVTFVSLALAGYLLVKVESVDSAVGSIRESIYSARAEECSVSTTWKSAGGLTHTVTTPQDEGEKPDAWAARHEARVNAHLVKFPAID